MRLFVVYEWYDFLIIYIYIGKIVSNKTKYLTLNSGAIGHKNTSI